LAAWKAIGCVSEDINTLDLLNLQISNWILGEDGKMRKKAFQNEHVLECLFCSKSTYKVTTNVLNAVHK
jgi:hypothetical protein